MLFSTHRLILSLSFIKIPEEVNGFSDTFLSFKLDSFLWACMYLALLNGRRIENRFLQPIWGREVVKLDQILSVSLKKIEGNRNRQFFKSYRNWKLSSLYQAGFSLSKSFKHLYWVIDLRISDTQHFRFEWIIYLLCLIYTSWSRLVWCLIWVLYTFVNSKVLKISSQYFLLFLFIIKLLQVTVLDM